MERGDEIKLTGGGAVTLRNKRSSTEDDGSQSKRPLIEKVNNVWGSTAGAGSDFFHIYRKQRAREMERLRALDEDYEKQQEDAAFQARREALITADAERAAKRMAKRKQQKQRKLQAKCLSHHAVNMNAFKNDGSFLEQVITAGSSVVNNENVVEEPKVGSGDDDVKATRADPC